MARKIRAAMKTLFAFFCCVAIFGGTLAPAYAERADRNKPMNVEADNLRHDDARQLSVFTGRVLISKGTIVIRGARVEVRQDAQGYQYGVASAEPGQRAFYRQKREGVDEYIEGEAELIEYDGKADTVRFVRRADMRRLRGAAVADEVKGSLIVYDHLNDRFSVDSGSATSAGNAAPSTTPGSGERIRAVLAPRLSSSASATGTPTTPAPAAAPLRPSPNLGGERR